MGFKNLLQLSILIMNAEIDKYLGSPLLSCKYLTIQNGVSMIRNLIIGFIILKELNADMLPFGCAWIQVSWLIILGLLMLVNGMLEVLLIPQFITLLMMQHKTKIQNQFQLKQILRSRLAVYVLNTRDTISFMFYFGFLMILFDLVFGSNDECFNTSNIRYLDRILQGFVILWFFCVTMPITQKFDSILQQESLRCFIFEKKNTSKKYQETCSICLQEFKYQEYLADYLCPHQHTYHRECIINWLKSTTHRWCPYCKQNAQKED
ncbi:hypothetical protein pb186bvf_017719 [Paramecium bursaria]